MSLEELDRTIRLGTADFSEKRFKYFSPSIDFIKKRVQDGSFNNSKFKSGRYTHLVSFWIKEEDLSRCRVSRNEIEVDRRKNVKISFIENRGDEK